MEKEKNYKCNFKRIGKAFEKMQNKLLLSDKVFKEFLKENKG